MFDVFYLGTKPNLFPHEQHAGSLSDARVKSRTKFFWLVNGNFDYTNFNFNWLPPVWEQHQTHVFRSQWQRNSGTMFAPKNVTEDVMHYQDVNQVTSKPLMTNWTVPPHIDINTFDFSWHPDFDDLPYVYHFPTMWQDTSGLMYTVPKATGIKFASVKTSTTAPSEVHYLEHYNPESASNLEKIKQQCATVKVSRFVDNYFDTLKRVAANANTEYIWIVGSICDYSDFDFKWTPGVWQSTMIHAFPTGTQKFGDTFYIHVPSFLAQINRIKKLEDFSVINYCNDQVVSRFSQLMDVVQYEDDSVADAIKKHSYTKQYAIFYPNSSSPNNLFEVPLWRKNDRLVHVLADNGSVVAAPRESQAEIKSQVYDYKHILTHKSLYSPTKVLDIVYISNGEPDAERWYNHLCAVAPNQKIHWVKDVNGRSEAYKAAAEASSTPWFFAVFAKLEMDSDFWWGWQPDYMQQPKHYIFNAKNPVNGLVYGHQACIAYNKKLVLLNDGKGLDFTLHQPHESVDMLSGIAHFNVSPIVTWRTAFREAIKLKLATDDTSAYRLKVWMTKAEGENAKWSLAGANDAVEYYQSVGGDIQQLLLSYEWKWLNDYYSNKYQS